MDREDDWKDQDAKNVVHAEKQNRVEACSRADAVRALDEVFRKMGPDKFQQAVKDSIDAYLQWHDSPKRAEQERKLLQESMDHITVAKHDFVQLVNDLAHKEKQVTELQARMSEMTAELRAVDRRRMVREFFTVADQEIIDRPHIPSESVIRLRMQMIAEEFIELLDAIFESHEFTFDDNIAAVEHMLRNLIEDSCIRIDMPALVDATVDLDYVVEGMRIELGVDSTPVWSSVHASNLAKRGGPRREDGKLLKPEGWVAPDIAGELLRQGWAR